MADNTTLNPGVGGDVIATEDLSGVKIQRIKLVIGDKDSDGPDVATDNPIPITAPGNINVTGTVTANAGTGTYLENLTQIGGNSVNANSGNSGLGTLRVVIATDQPAFANPVPVMGSVTANQGGSNWTENLSQIVGNTVNTAIGNTGAGTQRVVLASDQPNVPVIGTVTANQGGANWSENFSQIGGSTVNTAIGNTGAGTQRVVLASDQPNVPVTGVVTANAGTGTYLENLTQVGTNSVNTNSGNSGAGTLRVVIATDQPAFANPVPITGTVTANQGGTNWTENLSQIGGSTVNTAIGNTGAGTQRVVLASDQPNVPIVNPAGGILDTNLKTVGGTAVSTAALGVQKVGIIGSSGVALDVISSGHISTILDKRTGSTSLSPNYFSSHITTSTGTAPTGSNCYLQSILVSCSGQGTTWALKVQTGEATPKVLVPNFVLNSNLSVTNPFLLEFGEPILTINGINIVTVGGTTGTVDVFGMYWQ